MGSNIKLLAKKEVKLHNKEVCFAECTVSGNDDTPDHSRRRRFGLRGRIVPAVATTARRTAGEHANTSRAIHFSLRNALN